MVRQDNWGGKKGFCYILALSASFLLAVFILLNAFGDGGTVTNWRTNSRERPLLVIADGNVGTIVKVPLAKSPKGTRGFARSDSRGLKGSIAWKYLGTKAGGDLYKIDLAIKSGNRKAMSKTATAVYRGQAVSIIEMGAVIVQILPIREKDTVDSRPRPQLLIRDNELGLVVPANLANGPKGTRSLSRSEPPLPARTVRWTYLGTENGVESYRIEVQKEAQKGTQEVHRWSATMTYSGKDTPAVELGPVIVRIAPLTDDKSGNPGGKSKDIN